MEIIWLQLIDHEDDWNPDDPEDFEEWVMVNVGEEESGSIFQVHICTPMSIGRLENKRHVFMVDRWEGRQVLIERMNAFIKEWIGNNYVDGMDYQLSKVWDWEYEDMNKERRKWRNRRKNA